MRINFIGDVSAVIDGAGVLAKRLGFEISSDGLNVQVIQRAGDLEISSKSNEITIEFQEKIHFYRALGHIAEKHRQGIEEFSISEKPRFKTNGIMVDCSRNAVLTVESVKETIELMALMGLNMLMLYTEDTYEVEAYPYFGYMRGRYTQEELHKCDDYADMFGVEIVPCIQTLAHLEQALKWNYASHIRDTEDILLIGKKETYTFLEELIKSACNPFRSKRIHLGMDEAHLVGLGNFLAQNGYRNRFEIMNEHLSKVMEIVNKYDLKPMMWSDMYFRLGSATGDYYDKNTVITRDVIDRIPKGIEMVYWDYYHTDIDDYKRLIESHRDMECPMVFAGGVWTWGGIAANYPQTIASTNAALSACKDEGVDEVFATMWGDNGAETNFFTALLGMQLFAEHGYADTVDDKRLAERFKVCTGQDMDAFMLLGSLDPRSEDDELTTNPSKFILWQDILIGLFDKNIESFDYAGFYSDAASKLKNAVSRAGKYAYLFDAAYNLCVVLAAKADIGIRLKAAYDRYIAAGETHDESELRNFADSELHELKFFVVQMRLSHMHQWYTTNKPFGWEVIDMRFGGLLARIDTAIYRINLLLAGEIESIPELAEPRLPFDGDEPSRCNLYHRIASACVMTTV